MEQERGEGRWRDAHAARFIVATRAYLSIIPHRMRPIPTAPRTH